MQCHAAGFQGWCSERCISGWSRDVLWLHRCHFETGEAPEFNLVEMAPGMFGRSRRLIFRASTVEECCEWAIGLREAIRGD